MDKAKELVRLIGVVRVGFALGAIPIFFILGFKSWLGELGFLLLSPSPFLSLSIDFSQAVLGTLLFRMVLFVSLDNVTLFANKLRHSVFGTDVKPHEEPLTETQQMVINSGGTAVLVLMVYAPKAIIPVIVGAVLGLFLLRLGPTNIVDPSGVGMSEPAKSWNFKLLTMSSIALAWGFSYGVGYSRADHLANGAEITVLTAGVERQLTAMLPTSKGIVFFDKQLDTAVFIPTNSIEYVKN